VYCSVLRVAPSGLKDHGIPLESVSYDPRSVPTKFQNHRTSTGVTKSMSRF